MSRHNQASGSLTESAHNFACAGTRKGGKVHVFSLFKEEVIVPMFDLHFRQIQVQGFWLTQVSSHGDTHTPPASIFGTLTILT